MQINRTDVFLILALDNGKADCPVYGLTISELMEYLDGQGITKSRMTVYRRLRGLVESGFIEKGIPDNHSDTFFILEKGKDLIKQRKERQ